MKLLYTDEIRLTYIEAGEYFTLQDPTDGDFMHLSREGIESLIKAYEEWKKNESN